MEPARDYVLTVGARTSAGYGDFSSKIRTRTDQAETETSKIVMIVAVATCVVGIVLIAAFVCYKRTGRLFCLSLSPNRKKPASSSSSGGETRQNGTTNAAPEEQINLIGRFRVQLPNELFVAAR